MKIIIFCAFPLQGGQVGRQIKWFNFRSVGWLTVGALPEQSTHFNHQTILAIFLHFYTFTPIHFYTFVNPYNPTPRSKS